MQQNQSQNPMAVEPVPKLMARIGLPIVLSMILQAAYNVVDSAYLARMATGGETALTALSLAFPVQLFMVAVSIRSFWRWSSRRCLCCSRRWGWCLTSTPKARAAASAARC